MFPEVSNEMLQRHQLSQFKTYLNRLSVVYSMLIYKRLNDELNRDEYMVYDMMDMFIPLIAALDEVSSPTPYPSYIVEKLGKVKSYVDTTYAHFKEVEKSISESVNKDE